MRRFRLLISVIAVFITMLPFGPAGQASTVPTDMESHLPLPWVSPTGVQVENVYWGSNWDASNPGFPESAVNAATSALIGSSYFNGVTQYGAPVPSFTGSVNSAGCGEPSGTIDWTTVEAFVTCERTIAALPGAPIFTIYNIFVTGGVSITFPNERSCASFGAYHLATYSPLGPVFFAVMPVDCASSVGNLMALTGHEDVETLTDPVEGFFWYDADSAPPGFPPSVSSLASVWADPTKFPQLLSQLVNFFGKLNSEDSDLCEGGSPYSGTPDNFQTVPFSANGISMQAAAYWSNALHACVVGTTPVTEVTFATSGLPPGAAGLVQAGGTSVATDGSLGLMEGTGYSYPATVSTSSGTYYAVSGGCSGTVPFPAGSTQASTQTATVTCAYAPMPPGQDPVAVTYAGQFHVFARADGTGNLLHAWWGDGTWHFENLGGVITGAPSVTVYGSELIVAADGNDGQTVYTDTYNNGWSGWQPLACCGAGVATVAYAGQFHVFARDTRTGHLIHAWCVRCDGSDWNFADLGGVITGTPSVAVYGSQLKVAADGRDGQTVYTDTYNNGWSGWQQFAGPADQVGGAVFSGQFHIVAHALDTGHVVHAWCVTCTGQDWHFEDLSNLG